MENDHARRIAPDHIDDIAHACDVSLDAGFLAQFAPQCIVRPLAGLDMPTRQAPKPFRGRFSAPDE